MKSEYLFTAWINTDNTEIYQDSEKASRIVKK